MPVAAVYTLPVDAMQEVAASSGLQWVNTDANKVAAARAAIANESEPSHIPRERPALPSMDQEALVLVETRRDLNDLNLPFDAPRN